MLNVRFCLDGIVRSLEEQVGCTFEKELRDLSALRGGTAKSEAATYIVFVVGHGENALRVEESCRSARQLEVEVSVIRRKIGRRQGRGVGQRLEG